MTVRALLSEYGFEIDDIRWYLSTVMSFRLLSHREEPEELVRWIWSGRLSDELYRMEERFLEDLQEKLDRGLTDEHRVREILREVENAKRKRPRR